SPVDFCLEVPLQSTRLIGAHAEAKTGQILDRIGSTTTERCGEQAHHAALRRLGTSVALGKATRIAPGLHRRRDVDQKCGGHRFSPSRARTSPPRDVIRLSSETSCTESFSSTSTVEIAKAAVGAASNAEYTRAASSSRASTDLLVRPSVGDTASSKAAAKLIG